MIWFNQSYYSDLSQLGLQISAGHVQLVKGIVCACHAALTVHGVKSKRCLNNLLLFTFYWLIILTVIANKLL